MKGNKTPGDLILQEELLKIMPVVNGANKMARELQKGADYEITLVSPNLRGQSTSGLTEIWVKLQDESTGNVYYIPKAEFMNRKFEMQEMYQDYLEDNPNWNNVANDPFLQPADQETIIGYASIYVAGFA